MAFNLNLLFKIIEARIFEIPLHLTSLKIDIAQSLSLYIFIFGLIYSVAAAAWCMYRTSIYVNIQYHNLTPPRRIMVIWKGIWFVAPGWLTLDMQMLMMKLQFNVNIDKGAESNALLGNIYIYLHMISRYKIFKYNIETTKFNV